MKRKTRGRIFSLVVLILVGLVVFNRHRIAQFISPQEHSGDLELEEIIEYPITRDATSVMDDVYVGSDATAFFEDGQFRVHSPEGELVWSKEFHGPILVDKSRDRYLIAEKQTGNTYVFDLKGEFIGSALAQGALSRVELLEDNRVLLGGRGNRRIMLLDETMETTADIRVLQGSIINYNVSLDGNNIVCLVLDDTEGELRSSVFIYNAQGELIKMRPLTAFATDATIFGNELFVVYQDRIMKYDQSLEQLDFELELNQVSSSERIGDSLLITTGHIDPTRGFGELELIEFSLNNSSIKSRQKIKENYDNIEMTDDYYATYTRNMLRIYDKSGVEQYYQTYDTPLRKVSLLDDERIALIFPNRLIIYQIQ